MGLRLIIVLSLAAFAYCVDFDEHALKGYHSCDELSVQDCWSYHEAFEDKCKSECDAKKAGGGAATTTAAANPTSEAGHGKKKGCFHGDDSVITNYGPMKMSDLASRDDIKVLTRNDANQLEMSPIYSWQHVNPTVEFEFYIFTTESGKELPITGGHLIYETDCQGNSQTIFAKKVQVGKCLYVNDNGEFKESKVVEKRKEIKVGIYAPVTVNGNIVVNDVLASCYATYENENIQKIIYSFLHRIKSFLPSSFYANLDDAPQVLISFIDLSNSFTK